MGRTSMNPFPRLEDGHPHAVKNERTSTLRCPACGQEVAIEEAREKAKHDDAAPLTCPTCGAGFDREGNLRHEAAIGP
jgi:predicted RNA-binding Zn-ribbon protein involved in translation (DUF1610 family)